MVIKDKPEIFRFRDYREFLRCVYESRKVSEYGFSYRSFARKVGLGSPNYLKLVSEGRRNLTPEMAGRFARALELSQDAERYFCDLVAFNQAATAAERERCYIRIARYRGYRERFRLDDAHSAYHSHWYIPVIRELAACRGFDRNPRWIARALRPNISVQQAKQALEVLQQLGFLVENELGKLQQNEPIVSTGDDSPLGHHVIQFHRAMMQRAAEALDTVPREEREVASLTLGLGEENFRYFKKRLYELRQELLDASLDEKAGEATQVVQVNFQMFPMSRDSEESP